MSPVDHQKRQLAFLTTLVTNDLGVESSYWIGGTKRLFDLGNVKI